MNGAAQTSPRPTRAARSLSLKCRLGVAALAMAVGLVTAGCLQFANATVRGFGSFTVDVTCFSPSYLLVPTHTALTFDETNIGTTFTISVPIWSVLAYYLTSPQGGACVFHVPQTGGAAVRIQCSENMSPQTKCFEAPNSLVVTFDGSPAAFPDVEIMVTNDFTPLPTPPSTEPPATTTTSCATCVPEV